jgi:hypothetical protein
MTLKITFLILFIIIGFIGLAQHVAENNSESIRSGSSSVASACIVTPLEITKNVDLVFGNIASGSGTGTVTVAADGTRNGNGSIILIETGNTNTAAQFSIIGHAFTAFAITIPALVVISNGTSQMTVSNFISDLGATSTLNSSGEASLNIGATLTVNPGQEPGLYTGSFEVTLAYN